MKRLVCRYCAKTILSSHKFQKTEYGICPECAGKEMQKIKEHLKPVTVARAQEDPAVAEAKAQLLGLVMQAAIPITVLVNAKDGVS